MNLQLMISYEVELIDNQANEMRVGIWKQPKSRRFIFKSCLQY